MIPELKRLQPGDFDRAAADLNVPVAAVRAVTEVESRGTGFFDDGRPIILFERHIMYRRLSAAVGKAKADQFAQTSPDVVNPASGGYVGGIVECDRMDKAARINRTCALESASWGMFQIMGFNWQFLGFDSIQGFVNAMYRSEGEHLAAFVKFVRGNPSMWAALRVQDWAKFASQYNGPNYVQNKYDTKLAAAFVRHDTEVA